uniref:BTB_2 domain-containing protein n=1 Tax=Rhabditophanes sp. KR3021 TaxID=114890 RepID=A0AC35TKI6_9BILA
MRGVKGTQNCIPAGNPQIDFSDDVEPRNFPYNNNGQFLLESGVSRDSFSDYTDPCIYQNQGQEVGKFSESVNLQRVQISTSGNEGNPVNQDTYFGPKAFIPLLYPILGPHKDRFLIKVCHGGYNRFFTCYNHHSYAYFRKNLYSNPGVPPYKGNCTWTDLQGERIVVCDEQDFNSMLDYAEMTGNRCITIQLSCPSGVVNKK